MRPMNALIRLILMIAALSTLPGPAKLSRKTSFKFRVLYREPCRPDQPAQRKQRYADVPQTSDNPLASLKVTLDEYLMHKLASNHVCTFSQISKSRNPIPLITQNVNLSPLQLPSRRTGSHSTLIITLITTKHGRNKNHVESM